MNIYSEYFRKLLLLNIYTELFYICIFMWNITHAKLCGIYVQNYCPEYFGEKYFKKKVMATHIEECVYAKYIDFT